MENEQLSLDLSTQLEQIVLSEDIFPVDFDSALEWAGYSTKQKAVDCLKKNFAESSDYNFLVEVASRPQGGTVGVHRYKLTKECFKSFCMLAQTEKGKEVRKYYLEVESKYQSLFKPKSKAHALLQMSEMLHKNIQVLIEHEERLDSHDQRIEKLEETVKNAQTLAIEAISKNSGDTGYSTVIGFLNSSEQKSFLKQNTAIGKLASKLCKEQNITVAKVSDERYGFVNSYPKNILQEAINQISQVIEKKQK